MAAKIVRYNGDLAAFASAAPGTERTIFGDVAQADDLTSQINADFLRGWGIVGPSDQPTLEDFNAVGYTHGQLLAYLHQVGVAEYNDNQEYHSGSLCNYLGEIFSSRTNNNTGNTPASSPLSWLSAGSGRLIGVQTFTSSGVYTPSPGTKSVIVEMVGGGGAGGGSASTTGTTVGCASGGWSGAYAKGRFTSAFSGVTISVGVGGTAAVAGNNQGGTGGTSSFGALMSAPGGLGGGGSIAGIPPFTQGSTPGPMSGPTGANIVGLPGEPGGFGVGLGTSSAGAQANISSGQGGSCMFGNGGWGSSAAGSRAGNGFGSGSSGAANLISSAAQPSVAGQPGVVIVWEYS